MAIDVVDTAEKARLEAAIREAQGQADLLEQRKVELQALVDAVNEKDKDIRKRTVRMFRSLVPQLVD